MRACAHMYVFMHVCMRMHVCVSVSYKAHHCPKAAVQRPLYPTAIPHLHCQWYTCIKWHSQRVPHTHPLSRHSEHKACLPSKEATSSIQHRNTRRQWVSLLGRTTSLGVLLSYCVPLCPASVENRASICMGACTRAHVCVCVRVYV